MAVLCLFVPYTNPHFWTDRNQNLHTSPPWSGRDRRVCMGPKYFTFPTFSIYFVGNGCRFVRSRWLPAPHFAATALYPWCGASRCDVTDGGRLYNENIEKWMECVCVKMETWWDRKKWLMNCTWNFIAFMQMTTKNLNFVRPSSVPVYGQHMSSPFQPFPSFQRDFLLTGRKHSAAKPESHVCVCVGSPSVYIPFSTFTPCFVVSGECFANGMTTLWSMLLTWANICCMLESRKPYKHLYSGSWRENKELQWHFKQMVTFQFRYMSLLSY
jgi:hypothetical protein